MIKRKSHARLCFCAWRSSTYFVKLWSSHNCHVQAYHLLIDEHICEVRRVLLTHCVCTLPAVVRPQVVSTAHCTSLESDVGPEKPFKMSRRRLLQSAVGLQQTLRSPAIAAVENLDQPILGIVKQLQARQHPLGGQNLWSRSISSSSAAFYNGRGYASSSSYYIPTRPPPNYGIR
jgi:hypothetical protein